MVKIFSSIGQPPGLNFWQVVLAMHIYFFFFSNVMFVHQLKNQTMLLMVINMATAGPSSPPLETEFLSHQFTSMPT